MSLILHLRVLGTNYCQGRRHKSFQTKALEQELICKYDVTNSDSFVAGRLCA